MHMSISAFDIFKIGIGPSSSHTVGPMRAACTFARGLLERDLLERCARIESQLYGSLGATGRGHGTDKAVMLGLQGHDPETVDVDAVEAILQDVRTRRALRVVGRHEVTFDEKRDLHFHRRKTLELHVNGMQFTAFDAAGSVLDSRDFYSIGGGFVITREAGEGGQLRPQAQQAAVAHDFQSGAELLAMSEQLGCSIADLMRHNERHWRSDAETEAGLLRIWRVMQSCIARGSQTEGILPGGFRVKRRAALIHRQLLSRQHDVASDPLLAIDWVNLYAMAVNEENAAGGRVVTAPTNGAAGIVPAVLNYYVRFVPGANDQGIVNFLLTAAAIAILYKKNASISGAEVGCQGEVGVACSMAAGALCEVLGGTPGQVENAAEIGMEHHLGLTCDPVGGLVQIPCIERNAIASVKAINAARLALRGDGTHHVSLDKVIKTMRETGADMLTKYKETARGGLAVNVVAC